MLGTVSQASIDLMLSAAALSFALPIGLLVYFRKKKGADYLPFVIGCMIYILFAMVLEGFFNNLLFGVASFGEALQKNIWLYAILGGLMAGLFEETGRFFAFRTLLKDYQEKDANALMYGAGHGGIEAVVLLGINYMVNIAYAVMINSGGAADMLNSLPAEAQGSMSQLLETLVTTPSWHYILGFAERAIAIVLHISLSVLVWYAAKDAKRRMLYPLAIGAHMLVDALGVILGQSGMNLLFVEAVIAAATAAVAWYARRLMKDASR